VSGAQLSRDNLIRVVREALDDNRLEPEWLGLELTESAAMQDVTRAIKSLEKLRELGIKLSLDDFGTGYSSLSYLKRIPIHSVKIDRSFITDITRSVEDATIALAVIAIARSLGLTSVAEGVETFAQLNYLAQNHCDEMQGYLFSAPLNSETFATLLRERPRLDRRQSAASNGRSLLIVDDELSIGKALTRLLRRDGYHILVAGSGEQALEMLAMHRVQVIISDQRMPGMSGTELLDKVKILYPDTIRMVLSGYTDLNVITESVNRGAVFRFLTKPWDDDNLRAQVRDAFLHHDGQNSTP
jgi:CheY-like chemotaxis protein